MVPNWLIDRTNQKIAAGCFAVVSFGVPFGWSLWEHYHPAPAPTKVSDICPQPPARLDIDDHTQMVLMAKAEIARSAAVQGSLTDQRVLEIKQAIYAELPDAERTELSFLFVSYSCNELMNDPSLPQKVKNEGRNRISLIMITADSASRIKTENIPPVQTTAIDGTKEFSLDGQWSGQYYYNANNIDIAEWPPVRFRVDLASDYSDIYGNLVEPLTFAQRDTNAKWLLATIVGHYSPDGTVEFKKTYSGVAGTSHWIEYKGVWDTRSGTITGIWESENNPGWWGRFVMIQESPMPGLPQLMPQVALSTDP